MSPRQKLLLCVPAYLIALHFAYVLVLSSTYGYEGFRYNHDLFMVATAWCLSWMPASWLPTTLLRPSQVVYWILYLLVVVPVVVVSLYSAVPGSTVSILTATSVILSFGMIGLSYKLPLATVVRYRIRSYQFWVVVTATCAICYAAIIATFGLHFDLAPLSDVYSVRSRYEAALSNANPLLGYAMGWQSYVLNPMLIALGLISRRKLATMAGVTGQLFIYSITGFRTALFSTLLLIGFLVLLRAPARFGYRAALGWAGAVAASTALYLWFGSIQLFGLIVERLTAMPGLLTALYFAFFSNHPKMLLSHSVLRSFFNNPYSSEPPVLIGQVYFPGSGIYANANLWADAFANFGYVGVFIVSALLGLLMWFYDSITVESDFRLAALVLAMPALALANSGLLTSLLTHGIGFALVLMYFLPEGIESPAWMPARYRYEFAGSSKAFQSR